MDENEELVSLDDAESEPSFDYAARKRRIVVLMFAYAAVLGIIAGFLPEGDSPLDFIIGLPLLVLMISWCFTDAVERNHRIGRLMRLLLLLLFIVGFPIYLLQTRGIGAFKSLVLALLLAAAIFTCFVVTGTVTLYVGDVAGLWKLEN